MLKEIGEKVIELEDKKQPKVSLPKGASGTQFFSGFYNIQNENEYVQELKGARALDTYNRMMKSDAQVNMALLALTNPIVNANWTIIPAGDLSKDDPPTPKEIEASKKINSWWFDEDFKWEESLRQICSFFGYGFSAFEKSYKIEDGFIKLKRLAPRLQKTIVEWEMEDDELKRVRQFIGAGKTARDTWIDAKNMVVFSYNKEGDDYRGQSVLRAAYKHWFYKDTFERIDAIRIERWAIGIPKITQKTSKGSKDSRNAIINAVKNLKADESAYVYETSDYEVSLLDSSAGKMVDVLPSINHHNAMILKAIMAQFLELGQTETGARSLGETLKDMYLMGLSFSANYISEVIRQSIFKEMTAWNFGPDVRPPHLIFDGIQPNQLETLSVAYSNLISSGAVTKDESFEAHVRAQLSLPPKDEIEEEEEIPMDVDVQPVDDQEDIPTNPNVEDPEEDIKEPIQNKQFKLFDEVQSPTVVEFKRPLRECETYVSLREIAGRLDDTKEIIVKVTQEARERIISDLLEKMARVIRDNSPMGVQQLDYTQDIDMMVQDALIPVLNDILEYGREQVDRELNKQIFKKDNFGKKVTAGEKWSFSNLIKWAFPGVTSPEQKKALREEYILSVVLQFIEKALDPLVDEARAQARTAIRTGTVSITAIKEALEAFSVNAIRKSANYIISEAFSFGREERATERQRDIAYAEYSAILDTNSCGPCSELDGQQFEVDSPEYEEVTPPLYKCEGGTQCRCIWVYVAKSESR